MRKRLKADFVGDFADPDMWIEQALLGALDADTSEIIGEVEPGSLLELLAEIKGAHVHSLRLGREGEILGIVWGDEFSSPGNDRGLGVFTAEDNLVCDDREMLCEDLEQLLHRLVLFRRKDPGMEVGFA